MILQLATKYQKHIAFSLLYLFCFSAIASPPAYNSNGYILLFQKRNDANYQQGRIGMFTQLPNKKIVDKPKNTAAFLYNNTRHSIKKLSANNNQLILNAALNNKDIDGPSQPEMSSFKSVNADNMVNLFTGDFNYNIPLLDVGGYPVNIFYDGNVGMEQEASWVGLGWNINPGSISRSIRGVPDDFDDTDTLKQTQSMKPNITVGARIGGDLESLGIKDFLNLSLSGSLGVSVNNYLGPALEVGLKGGANFSINSKVTPEKSSFDSLKIGVSVGADANLSSRYGFTLSPNVSMTATAFRNIRTFSSGLSLSTSYNSRYGIKELQISEQMRFNKLSERKDKNNNNETFTSSVGQSIAATTISFAKPSYSPAIRMPVTNTAISGRFGFVWTV